MEIVNDITVQIASIDEWPAAYTMMEPENGTIVYYDNETLQEWSIYDGTITYRRWTRHV